MQDCQINCSLFIWKIRQMVYIGKLQSSWRPITAYFSSSSLTAKPIFSSKNGFFIYAPAPGLWASLTLTRPVSENPIATITSWTGRSSRFFCKCQGHKFQNLQSWPITGSEGGGLLPCRVHSDLRSATVLKLIKKWEIPRRECVIHGRHGEEVRIENRI